MNMTKICNCCGKEKSLSHFHKLKKNPDGHNNKCSICVNNYNKVQLQKKVKEIDTLGRVISIVNASKNDYLNMYLFLKFIDYDPSKDIHKQFCEKYNLPYKIRDNKSVNKFSWDDCIKTDELETL